MSGRRRATGYAAAAGTLGVLLIGANAVAQDRPSEDDMFGGQTPAEPPAESPREPSSAPPPATQSAAPEPRAASPAPAAASRDADIMGGARADMFQEEPAPDDPLEIGGQLYLRTQTTALEGQAPSEWTFSAPTLLDVYLDARPNDRVRGFVLGRMSFDSTLPTRATILSGFSPDDGSAAGSSGGSGSPDALFQQQTRGPHMALDQMWLRFDISHTVFVTAGKQHVRWGTGRFWAPTDYLHFQRRNPLDVFDARSGTTMIKLHLPVESKAWNFYAYGVTESDGVTPTLESIAGAARAELVFGPTELGLGAFIQRNHKPKYAADLSFGIGDFDFYSEVALRDGGDVDRLHFAPDAVVPDFGPTPSWESPAETAQRQLGMVVDTYYPVYRSEGLKAQAVGGVTYSQKYNDNDTFTLGAEYFYNGLGYQSPAPYPGLVLAHSTPLVDPATFFYLGQQYAALFLALPAPYSLDNHSFTLSVVGNLFDISFITRLDYGLTVLTHLRFEAFVGARFGNENGEFRFGVQDLELGGINFSRPPAILDLGLGLRVDI